MIVVNQPLDIDSAQRQVVTDRLGPSAEELEVGSPLQSSGITPTAKVGTLIPLVFFHSFPSP